MTVDDEASDFPVVCAGGSAREVDAHTRLLRNLPADMGVAIVIVNHLTALPSYGDHPPIAKQLIAGDLAHRRMWSRRIRILALPCYVQNGGSNDTR